MDRITNTWRLTSLSELDPLIFDMELTHLGSEASIYNWNGRSYEQLKKVAFPKIN